MLRAVLYANVIASAFIVSGECEGVRILKPRDFLEILDRLSSR